MLNIPLSCSDINKFYEFYIEVLNCLTKLSDKEKKLVICLLVIHYGNRTSIQVDELLLSKSTRKFLQSHLDISEANLNNLISSLKKKEIIKNNTLAPEVINYPSVKDKSFSITFNIKMNE